ncbi:transposase [Amphibacillus sp. MSJ-3]|uniref:transposase n=1 Tax=Amphibacillus sp. MSJ-3 TaxID=2841505 RepID=UPI0035303374
MRGWDKTYGQGKIDVEPFFGLLKANLGFVRLSLRGKSKVHNELRFALLAVNLREFTANNSKISKHYKNENGSIYGKIVNKNIFYSVRLVISRTLTFYIHCKIVMAPCNSMPIKPKDSVTSTISRKYLNDLSYIVYNKKSNLDLTLQIQVAFLLFQ